MRTKSSAHHIPTVIDLTYSQEQHQETSPPGNSTKQQLTPSAEMKKDAAKPARGKNATAKVRKVPCSNKKPSIKRKRIHEQDTPVVLQQHHAPTGLYQFDLTEMIRQKLKVLFEPPMMMAAHGNSFIPNDPRYGWGTAGSARQPASPGVRTTSCGAPPYQPCRVPGCSQEAISASLSRHHYGRRTAMAQPGGRFSIFRSVELMAQSSCVAKH